MTKQLSQFIGRDRPSTRLDCHLLRARRARVHLGQFFYHVRAPARASITCPRFADSGFSPPPPLTDSLHSTIMASSLHPVAFAHRDQVWYLCPVCCFNASTRPDVSALHLRSNGPKTCITGSTTVNQVAHREDALYETDTRMSQVPDHFLWNRVSFSFCGPQIIRRELKQIAPVEQLSSITGPGVPQTLNANTRTSETHQLHESGTGSAASSAGSRFR